TGTVSCTMFPSTFAQQGQNLEKDRIVLLKGKANHRDRVRDDDEGSHIVEVLAEQITILAENGANGSNAPKKIVIRVDPSKRDVLRFVKETVEQHPGNGNAQEIYLHVPDHGRLHVIRTPLLAEFTEPFRAAIERLLGKQTIWVE
ncbi:MAG TPA: DNA polymerase III subunit alpha, partial [Chthonomonadaceae bacterium]|nr:DNA polymerase III subunit alpha [Chthonomonadaceae bacterium]